MGYRLWNSILRQILSIMYKCLVLIIMDPFSNTACYMIISEGYFTVMYKGWSSQSDFSKDSLSIPTRAQPDDWSEQLTYGRTLTCVVVGTPHVSSHDAGLANGRVSDYYYVEEQVVLLGRRHFTVDNRAGNGIGIHQLHPNHRFSGCGHGCCKRKRRNCSL